MCLSKAYIEKQDGKELIMEEVTALTVADNHVRLKTLFGEHREITASLKEVNFLEHNIILQSQP